MKLKPLRDRILIKRLDAEEMTAGGIVIPETAKEKPLEAEVLAVGPGRRLDDGTIRPLEVKVGDRVLIGKYSGTDIKLDGEDRVIVREDDVLGVVG